MAKKKSARKPSRENRDSGRPKRGKPGSRSASEGRKPGSARRPSSTSKKSASRARPARRSQTGEVRLQKVLALAGFGSRRSCEELITEGRVEVDKVVVTRLGTTVDPDKQKVSVDGEVIKRQRKQYFVVNKPAGVISTSKDPTGRAKVIDLISSEQRVFTVGRLDKSSEGLILLTNDGELANQLTHPKYGVEKIYHVQVAGSPGPEALNMLREGVHLAEGFAQVQRVKVRKRRKNFSELEIVLDEGRNREIRRLLARIGHKVLRLKRIAIGPLKIGVLPTGGHRKLTDDEISALRRSAESHGKSANQRASTQPRGDSERKSRSEESRSAGGRRAPARSNKKKVVISKSGTRRKKVSGKKKSTAGNSKNVVSSGRGRMKAAPKAKRKTKSRRR